MTDFATSNRVGLRGVKETTWGTTPGTPALAHVRFTSESLNYNADFITSEEIRSDRMTADSVQVSSQAGGDINGELSYGTYDNFIAAALYSEWKETGTALTGTDIGITKTSGTPDTWKLTSMTTDFTTAALVVGQHVKVAGFTTAGTFWAEVAKIEEKELTIRPFSDEATEAASESITITPLDYVRNGTTKSSFTLQKSFSDLATTEYWNFAGARVSSWGLELSTGAILTTSFGILAKDAQMTETQFTGATLPDATSVTVMNAVDNVAGIVFDGDPGSSFFFNSLSISLDNSLRGQEAVGRLGLVGVEAGRLSVTGSIELYFENSSLFDKFRASGTFALQLLVQDASKNTYVIVIPRAKYTSMEITAGGSDQDIFASAEFEAQVDATGTYQIQVSRS